MATAPRGHDPYVAAGLFGHREIIEAPWRLGLTRSCWRASPGAATTRCSWGRGQVGQLGYGNTEDIGDDEPAGAAGDVEIL